MEQALQRIQKNETRLDGHDKEFTDVWNEISNLRNLNLQIVQMNASLTQLVQSMKTVETKVDSVDNRLRSHELEPADSWKKLKWLVITLVVTAIITLILTVIGIK